MVEEEEAEPEKSQPVEGSLQFTDVDVGYTPGRLYEENLAKILIELEEGLGFVWQNNAEPWEYVNNDDENEYKGNPIFTNEEETLIIELEFSQHLLHSEQILYHGRILLQNGVQEIPETEKKQIQDFLTDSSYFEPLFENKELAWITVGYPYEEPSFLEEAEKLFDQLSDLPGGSSNNS